MHQLWNFKQITMFNLTGDSARVKIRFLKHIFASEIIAQSNEIILTNSKQQPVAVRWSGLRTLWTYQRNKSLQFYKPERSWMFFVEFN